MGLSTKDLGGLSVFGGHLLPPSDNAFDIGRPTRNWRNGYFQTAIYATSVIGNWSPSDPSLYSLGLTTKEWQGLYLGDDTGVYIGLDQDSVIYHRAATLNANTLLPGVLVGTPDVPALAANTFIISNTITSGDVLIAAANSSGNSQSFIRIDGSAGELNFDEVVIFKSSLTMPQDNNLNFGGLGFNIKYETADLDARVLKFIAPEGIATAVPVFVFGDISVNSTDLGAAGIDFSGYTEPTIAIVNDAGDAYASLDTGDINGSPAGAGLYFKAAADEDINILQLSVGGTPMVLKWHETADVIATWKNLVLGAGEGGVTLVADVVVRPPNLVSGAGDDNVAGADFYIRGALGRGAGDVGQIIFQTAQVAAADTVQTYETILTLDEDIALFTKAVNIADDLGFTIGTTLDNVFYHRTATLNADTALANVLIDGGAIDTTALATNSLIISNITASGDILGAYNRGGNSIQWLFVDGSSGITHLGKPGVQLSVGAGDVFIGAQLEVLSSLYARGTVRFSGVLKLEDDKSIGFGTTAADAQILYETADADAKILLFTMDESDDSGNNIPAFVFAEETNALNADLGLFDAFVEARVVTLNNAGNAYSSLGPALTLWEQASAPNEADVAGLGQLWVKNTAPNELWFTTDAGDDQHVAVFDADTGEMIVVSNQTATIETADTPHAFIGLSTGDVQDFSFVAGITGGITVYADYSGTVADAILVTAGTHGLVTNDIITIRGTTAPNDYNGIRQITKVNDNSFYFVEGSLWNADAGASDFEMGDYLLAGTGTTGEYDIAWNSSVSEGGGAGSVISFIPVQNITAITKASSKRKFANNDVGAMPGGAHIAITVGDRLWFAHQSSGTNDLTVNIMNFRLARLA